jgi:hypothetical protein
VNWGQFLRREWGAATFVVTVVAGLVAVPIALVVGGNGPSAPVNVPVASSPRTASAPSTATPAQTASPSPSPSKSP